MANDDVPRVDDDEAPVVDSILKLDEGDIAGDREFGFGVTKLVFQLSFTLEARVVLLSEDGEGGDEVKENTAGVTCCRVNACCWYAAIVAGESKGDTFKGECEEDRVGAGGCGKHCCCEGGGGEGEGCGVICGVCIFGDWY